MAAWIDAAVFDCQNCEETPDLKVYFGCDGVPRLPDGSVTSWKYGPTGDVRAELHECPTKAMADADDVWRLIRAGYLADWKLSIGEQDESSQRWLDAFAVARRECQDASIERTRDDTKAGA